MQRETRIPRRDGIQQHTAQVAGGAALCDLGFPTVVSRWAAARVLRALLTDMWPHSLAVALKVASTTSLFFQLFGVQD